MSDDEKFRSGEDSEKDKPSEKSETTSVDKRSSSSGDDERSDGAEQDNKESGDDGTVSKKSKKARPEDRYVGSGAIAYTEVEDDWVYEDPEFLRDGRF